MILINRTTSENKDFRELITLLDGDLNYRYGTEQAVYDQYNIIEAIDTVVVAYLNNIPAGCGCFKIYDSDTIEIKRMFVKSEIRGKGISKLILKELENWGIEKGFSNAILETGIKQMEAIGLYVHSGYHKIENFGPYAGMPDSICMKKLLK